VSYLAEHGVPPGLMFSQGFGYTVPADPANPYSPVNRRVEVSSIR
jgi:flagellar motor protein MotB